MLIFIGSLQYMSVISLSELILSSSDLHVLVLIILKLWWKIFIVLDYYSLIYVSAEFHQFYRFIQSFTTIT